jgi:ornithine cyclodeaminase/alanine dehydrogenase
MTDLAQHRPMMPRARASATVAAMPPTLVLSRKDLDPLCTRPLALEAVEEAFLAHGLGTARMPSKVYLSLPEHNGDFRAMPAFLAGAAGVKWVNSHPDNPRKHGLPSVTGVYILSDPATAQPLAIMDATLLTAMRTGAAAGVASKYLLGRAPRTVGFVGCGVQARPLLAAHRAQWPDVEVLCADLSPAAAERFAAEVGGRVVPVAEAAGADVVNTSTPSTVPVVKREWVKAGAHINAIGADGPGKQELEAGLLTASRVFVDDMDQATHSGEVNVPLHHGEYSQAQLAGTLGDVIAGKLPARPGDVASTITIFDSTGLAIQDVALARRLYDAARAKGVGVSLQLV